MLKDIVEARPLEAYKLYLRFEDGVVGIVDISQNVTFDGVFEPLRNHGYFQQVRVDPQSGTICWPNGADLDPDVLYSRVTGIPICVETRSTPA